MENRGCPSPPFKAQLLSALTTRTLLASKSYNDSMSDAFFTSKKRPFSTRTKDSSDGPSSSKPSRSGVSSRGASRGRGESRGRGRGAAASTRGGGRGQSFNKGKRRAEEEDEELDVESDDGSEKLEAPEEFSSEEEDDLETPAQKRLRLSQMYLKSLEKDKEGASFPLALPTASTLADVLSAV